MHNFKKYFMIFFMQTEEYNLLKQQQLRYILRPCHRQKSYYTEVTNVMKFFMYVCMFECMYFLQKWSASSLLALMDRLLFFVDISRFQIKQWTSKA